MLLSVLSASLVVAVAATQLTISIIKGADEIALYYAWNGYTSFWRSHSGHFNGAEFLAANPEFKEIAGPSSIRNLSTAVEQALRDAHRSPQDFHTVVRFTYGKYLYVALALNQAHEQGLVTPCYLLAFNQRYDLQASFWG